MPLTRTQIYVRRRIAVFGTLGALFAAGIYLPLTLLAPIEPAIATVEPYIAPSASAAELSMPGYGSSAIGAVGFANDLATGGSDKALPMASITKVVTALVVLEAHPLVGDEAGPTITFGAADEQIYRKFLADNGKVAPVRAQLTLTQREVLELVLIESANNYAESLAVWAFGSETLFLQSAREWLSDHELTDTSLADSTGMSPRNTSTAVNLVSLGMLALEHPVIADIVSTTRSEIAGVGTLDNTNDLLGISGVRGIKTGTLDEAGACLLFASDITVGAKTVVVIGVVLGADSHELLNSRVRALLAEASAGFHEVELSQVGESFAKFTTPWGDNAEAVATETLSAIVWSDTPALLLVKLRDVTLAEEGSIAGELVFTIGNRTIRSDLVIDSPIEDPGVWWRLTHPVELL